MKITEPTKPLLQLNDADRDFIKEFVALCDVYAESDNDEDFETFISNNYTISKFDLNDLMRLYYVFY